MAKFVEEGYAGKLEMSGKVNLGVPRSKVSSKGNSSCIDKATNRGKNTAVFGKK